MAKTWWWARGCAISCGTPSRTRAAKVSKRPLFLRIRPPHSVSIPCIAGPTGRLDCRGAGLRPKSCASGKCYPSARQSAPISALPLSPSVYQNQQDDVKGAQPYTSLKFDLSSRGAPSFDFNWVSCAESHRSSVNTPCRPRWEHRCDRLPARPTTLWALVPRHIERDPGEEESASLARHESRAQEKRPLTSWQRIRIDLS